MQLSWKENLFSAFFSAFLKSSLNFEHFQEKDDPHSWYISEIIDSEVRAEINVYKVGLRGSFEKQHGKGAQTLLKFERQHLYHIYWSMWTQLIYKRSLLVIWKIFGLFSNTLSADGKYSLLHTDNLTQLIQMNVYRREKSFSEIFRTFLKSSLNLEHFQKEDDPHSQCISEIIDSEERD